MKKNKCKTTCKCGCQEGRKCTCDSKKCTCGCQDGKCTCNETCKCGCQDNKKECKCDK